MKLISFLLLIFPCLVQSQVDFKFHGLKIFTSDIAEATTFYSEVLGFEVVNSQAGIMLLNKVFPIYIEEADHLSANDYPQESRTGLTLHVNHLLPTVDALKKKNVSFYDTLLARNGVGIAIPFEDSSDNVISLMEVQIYDPGPLNGIQVYNTGIAISNMDSARYFYQKLLGFDDWSTNYLPDALPLKHKKDQTFAFMIHWKKGLKKSKKYFVSAPQMILMFEVENLKFAQEYLESMKVDVTKRGSRLICQDPEGNWIEIFSAHQ